VRGVSGVSAVSAHGVSPRRPPARLPAMKEVKPDSNPGTVSPVEVAAAAESGQAPRWGKGTSRPEEGTFLEGPQPRSHELSRLFRIVADFLRGFRHLH